MWDYCTFKRFVFKREQVLRNIKLLFEFKRTIYFVVNMNNLRVKYNNKNNLHSSELTLRFLGLITIGSTIYCKTFFGQTKTGRHGTCSDDIFW